MADIALQSGRVSSLASALSTHTEKSSFVPKLQKGPATHFREVVRTASTSGGFASAAKVNAGGKITIDVSKLGLLTKACVRVRINATLATSNTMTWAPNLLAAMVSNIELGTSSRTLVSMSGQELARRINRSRHRSAYHRRGGYHWSKMGPAYNAPVWTNTTTAGNAHATIATNQDEFSVVAAGASGGPQPIDIYLPLLFSCFTSDASKGIMTSFTESLKITLTLRALAAWCPTTANVFTSLDASLIQMFVVPSQDIASSTIAATYPVGKSSQFIVSQEEILARADITPTVGGYASNVLHKEISVKLTSSSVSLLRGISCYVIEKKYLDGTTAFLNKYIPIKSFVFKASGRTLVDTNAAEADMFSLANKDDSPDNIASLITPNHQTDTELVARQYPEDSILTYTFSHDPPNTSYSSGHLGLAGCASQQYTVNFVIGHNLTGAVGAAGGTSAEEYAVVVVGHAISVKSVSSSSGAITNSLSV